MQIPQIVEGIELDAFLHTTFEQFEISEFSREIGRLTFYKRKVGSINMSIFVPKL